MKGFLLCCLVFLLTVYVKADTGKLGLWRDTGKETGRERERRAPHSFSFHPNGPLTPLSYTISPYSGSMNNSLLVEMKLQGNKSGKTVLKIPFEINRPYISHLEIRQVKNGNRHYFVKKDSSTFIIEHAPGTDLSITYLVKHSLRDSLPEHDEFNDAMVTENYFYVRGSALWIIPESKTPTNFNVKLEWKAFPFPAIINSFGAGKPYQEFTTTADRFLYTMFLGGDFRVHQVFIRKKILNIGIRGNWNFKDESLIEMAVKTVEGQRNFWNDHSTEVYNLALLPMKVQSANERSITGRGLYNSFVCIGTNTPAMEMKDLMFLFNHELMHHWFGQVLKQKHPENAYKWFHEGFTDYFSHLVMLEAGFLNGEAFRTRINSILSSYYSDSSHQYTNARLEKDYWSTAAFQQLPYKRGLIFALYLDESVKYHTQMNLNLKYIIRQMLFQQNNEEQVFSPNQLLQLLQKATGRNYKKDLERFIIRGRFIEMQDWNQVSTRFSLEPAEIYDEGFTTDKGIAMNARITSVKSGSNVEKSGLLVNDIMKGFSSSKNTSDTTTLIVMRGNEKIIMRYLPVRTVLVPQLK